jgi:hypothetical protein
VISGNHTARRDCDGRGRSRMVLYPGRSQEPRVPLTLSRRLPSDTDERDLRALAGPPDVIKSLQFPSVGMPRHDFSRWGGSPGTDTGRPGRGRRVSPRTHLDLDTGCPARVSKNAKHNCIGKTGVTTKPNLKSKASRSGCRNAPDWPTYSWLTRTLDISPHGRDRLTYARFGRSG